MTNNEQLYGLVIRLGDTALIHGQRLSEWTGKGPILEEDLALTNIALDYLGRASILLRYAAELEGKNKTEDDLAFRRSEKEYRNVYLAELPIGNFAYTIVKQLFLSTYEEILFGKLKASSNSTLVEIANKAYKEILYHKKHAKAWTIRLGLGSTLSHNKMQEAIQDLWMYVDDLFDFNIVNDLEFAEGKNLHIDELKIEFKNSILEILEKAKLKIPNIDFMLTGSKQGIHTEHLGHLLSELQYLHRTYPEAKW